MKLLENIPEMHSVFFLSKSPIKAMWTDVSEVVLGMNFQPNKCKLKLWAHVTKYIQSEEHLTGIFKSALELARVLFSLEEGWPRGFLTGALIGE